MANKTQKEHKKRVAAWKQRQAQKRNVVLKELEALTKKLNAEASSGAFSSAGLAATEAQIQKKEEPVEPIVPGYNAPIY